MTSVVKWNPESQVMVTVSSSVNVPVTAPAFATTGTWQVAGISTRKKNGIQCRVFPILVVYIIYNLQHASNTLFISNLCNENTVDVIECTLLFQVMMIIYIKSC